MYKFVRVKFTIKNSIIIQRWKRLEWIKQKFRVKFARPRFCVSESFQKFASMCELMLTILFAIRDTGYHIEKFKSVHTVWKQSNLSSSKSYESRFRTDVDTLLQTAFATFFIFYILQAKNRRSNTGKFIDVSILFVPCIKAFHSKRRYDIFLFAK